MSTTAAFFTMVMQVSHVVGTFARGRRAVWIVVFLLGSGVTHVPTTAQPVATSPPSAANNVAQALGLTAEERAWLGAHKTVRVGIDANYPPYSFLDARKTFVGVVPDALAWLSARTGIVFEPVYDLTWPEILDGAKQGSLDVIATVVTRPERRDFLHFTSIYIPAPLVLMTRVDDTRIHAAADLAGKKVALVTGYSTSERVVEEYPTVVPHEVRTPLEGLQAVASGEADAYVGVLGVNAYLAAEYGLGNLHVAARYDLETNGQRFGVRKDWPILRDILQKALNDFSLGDKRRILQKWVGPTRQDDAGLTIAHSAAEEGYGRAEFPETAMWWVGVSLAAFAGLALLVVLMVRGRRAEALGHAFGTPGFRQRVMVALGLCLAVVAVLAWWGLESNRHTIEEQLRANLQMVLHASSERLQSWVDDRKLLVQHFARDPALRAITARLLRLPLDRQALGFSPARDDAHAFFAEYRAILGRQRFFITNTAYVNIASMQNRNLGKRNVLAQQRPALMARALQGETVFVPPMQAQPQTADGAKERVDAIPSMFVVAPIRDGAETVIALLVQQVGRDQGFSRVLQAGRLGETGETYAFDRTGTLLSESRFNRHLRDIGLLSASQPSSLAVEIRDPGGNLLQGYQPTLPRAEQPLTHMAASAVRGEAGLELDGYRDYRGVLVAGAWLWNEPLGLGLATEIDLAEAFALYHVMRWSVIGVLGMTLTLAVGGTLCTLFLGERANLALRSVRQHLEQRVEERTSEINAIVESAADGIVIFTVQGIIQSVNPTAERIFGYTAAEVLEKHVTDFIHVSDRDDYERYMDKFLQRGVPDTMGSLREVQGLRKDGSVVPLMFSLGRMRRGEQLMFIAILRDITERKQAERQLIAAREEAEAANQAKSVFLAHMSHELRTPLNAVLGFSELMAREPGTTAKQRENLHIIGRSGRLLLTLIDNILDMSKIETGRIELISRTIDLHDFLDDIANLIRVQAEGKGLAFTVEQEPDLPHYVTLDAEKVRQVLINLLGNAVKFTDQGGVVFRVRSETVDSRSQVLTFAIEDSGIGIPPDKLEVIFEPFVQAGRSPSKEKGTGLGLAIARRFAHVIGGELSVESVEGQGAVFHFTVPVVAAEERDVEQAAAPCVVVGLADDESEWRILVVDDSPESRQLLRQQLAAAGFRVGEVADGAAGVQMFETWQPHLIWMDMRMPGMDGYEATRRIRQLPGGMAVKIVALTASVFQEQEAHILAAGCDSVLRKPYRAHEIFDVMAQHLGVRYRYAEDSVPGDDPVALPETARLEALPPALLSALHEAALELDTERLGQIIEQLAAQDTDLAVSLRDAVDHFRFAQLLTLLDEASMKESDRA